MYSIGREVEVSDVSGERAILSLIGPRSVEIAATAVLPENACESTSVAGRRVPRGRHPRGDRPDRRGRRGRAPARGADRSRRGRGLGRGGRDPPPRGRGPALRGRDGNRDDAGRGGHRRGAPSASPRAATSARRRSPGSTTRAGPTATCAGCELSGPAAPGTALMLGEKEVGRLGSATVSPALGPIGLAILRREAEPGAELAVGEDGVTARSSRLALRLDSAAMGRGRARAVSVGVLGALALAVAPAVAPRATPTTSVRRCRRGSASRSPRTAVTVQPGDDRGRPRSHPADPAEPEPPAAADQVRQGPADGRPRRRQPDPHRRQAGAPRAQATTAPARSPAGSAGTFQTQLPAGTYTVSAAGVPGARPGKLVVGDFRASLAERRPAA